MESEKKNVGHVVVDSGGFIRNAPLREIADNIYTLQDVVSEIRDKTTRQRLQVLPYSLNFREPSTEAIRAVTEFSKKTGDYPSLSAVDIRVISLVYQLEKEFVGKEHIKETPDRNITWGSSKQHLEKPTEIAGFYYKKKEGTSTASSRTTSECPSQSCTEGLEERMPALEVTDSTNTTETTEDNTTSVSEELTNKVEVEIVDQDSRLFGEGDVISSELLEEEEDEDDEEEEDDDEDNDGWITPSNIKQVRAQMGDKNTEEACVTVGCLTTDFAMQNVLIQMGLNVISVDGMLIKKAKSYVLRCYGCFKITTNMMKEFCFHCGNKTLQKVSMSVDDEGNVRYFLSRRKPISLRGTKFSLPTPKGGKRAVNPRLVEDQRLPHQRESRRAKASYNAMDADYVSNLSPFAPIDTDSRAAQLGIRHHQHRFKNRRNPNENKGKRK